LSSVYVCHCKVISDQTVRAAIASGALTVADITSRCKAGGGCGGCHGLLQAMIDAADSSDLTGASAA
jgi:assimilatory nitrate reductase electron transfer subunit